MLKQKFAQTSLAYMKSYDESPKIFVSSVILAMITGMSIGPIIDSSKPIESTPLLGQETAIEQYSLAINTLDENKATLDKISEKSPYIPEKIKHLIKDSKHISSSTTEEKNKTIKAKEMYQTDLSSLIDSALTDTRLNEQNIKDIFSTLTEKHDIYNQIPQFQMPDFNDIQECRAEINSSHYITDCSNKIDKTSTKIAIATSMSVVLAPLLLLFPILRNKERLQKWKDYRPPKPN